MSGASPADELLVVLLVNLRNAAATFGEGSVPHETIRKLVEEHKLEMSMQHETSDSSLKIIDEGAITSGKGKDLEKNQGKQITTAITLPLRLKPPIKR